ncbi:MAG: phosphotransferase [Caldilineaceae bacterium]
MRTLLQSAPANADEPVVQALVHFLLEKINELSELIDFTERLADTLRSSPLAFVLCHGDMHGWNLLIDNDDRLFIVDWDTLILAPKERDLMFIGGGHGDSGYRAEEEEMLFYRGYGKTLVNHDALAYYRFARALEDIVLFAEQILSTDNDDNAEDRQQALHYLQSNFLPESTIAQAYRALYDSSRLGPSDDSMQSGKAKQRWST